MKRRFENSTFLSIATFTYSPYLSSQGKLKQALDDYIYAGLMQQLMNEAPSHQAKVESIVKELAQKGADALFKTMRAATSSGARALPSKSHCKNFLESYPSMHLWAPHYRGQSRSVLEEALKEVTATADADAAQGADAEGAEGAAPDTSSIASPAERELQVRQHTLDLVCFDLVHNRFSDAFALLATLPLPAEEEPAAPDALDASYPLLFLSPFGETYRTNAQVLLSLQCELIGFDKHLRCDLTGAVAAYQRALRHYPNNIDARLKLANVYLEVPDLAATSAVFATLMAHYETLDKRSENVAIMMAWTLLHWVSVFVTR